jgi:hypothetical protein
MPVQGFAEKPWLDEKPAMNNPADEKLVRSRCPELIGMLGVAICQ